MNRFEWERQAYGQRFNGEALRVLWAYASHADADTMVTFPSIRKVSEQTGISVEKVQRFRKELLTAGWLVETDEMTTRGNKKLKLAAGADVVDASYLGTKKAMSPKSRANLVPAAKQKKARSLDTPDTSRLEHREGTCLEHRDIGSLDTPDVSTITNNQDRTTKNNQVPADASAAAADQTIKENDKMTYEYLGSLNSQDFEDFSLVKEVLSVDVYVNSEGVHRDASTVAVAPVRVPEEVVEVTSLDEYTVPDGPAFLTEDFEREFQNHKEVVGSSLTDEVKELSRSLYLDPDFLTRVENPTDRELKSTRLAMQKTALMTEAW